MPATTMDPTQRRAARWIGLLYLPSFIIVLIINMWILGSLIVVGNPTQTIENIMANEAMFRYALIGNAAYAVAVFALAAALHALLRPLDALGAGFVLLGRTVFGLTWLLVLVNEFTALRLISKPEYAQVLGSDALGQWVRLYLSGYDLYYVGLLFWSLAATQAAWLLRQSTLIPRALANAGLVASIWCVLCTIAHFANPGFPKLVNLWFYDLPMVLFEIAASLLLLLRSMETREHPAPVA